MLLDHAKSDNLLTKIFENTPSGVFLIVLFSENQMIGAVSPARRIITFDSKSNTKLPPQTKTL